MCRAQSFNDDLLPERRREITGAPVDARPRPRRRPTPASLGNVYEKRYHETVISVAISADDTFFAAGGAGRKAMVWRVEDGELFASFETRDTITSIAFVGDALLAATLDCRRGHAAAWGLV